MSATVKDQAKALMDKFRDRADELYLHPERAAAHTEEPKPYEGLTDDEMERLSFRNFRKTIDSIPDGGVFGKKGILD